MKSKFLVVLMAVLMIASGLAVVYAEDVSVGSAHFAVPDDFNISSSNDTAVVLSDNENETIIFDYNIKTADAAKAYLTAEGYKAGESYNSSVENHELGGKSSSYSYTIQEFTKGNETAGVYVFNVDNENYVIIAKVSGLDSDDDFDSTDVSNAVDDIVKAMMG